MKTQNIFVSFLAIILAFGITSCKKNDPTSSVAPTVMVEFDNVAGSADLAFNTNYVNSSGETFKISNFTYYISNVSLKKSDGTVFTVAQDDSYFLIKESVASSQMVELKNVPEGDYQSVTFTVGVDSIRSCAPIDKRTGVLDPANSGGMYWEWTQDYVNSMLEGTSAISTDPTGTFVFHVGGAGGCNAVMPNNTRIVTVPFKNTVAQVRNSAETEIHLMVDALQVFGTNSASVDNRVSIAATPRVMGSALMAPTARKLAGNYQNGVFSFVHIHTNPK